jgi:hypothetical protein
LGKEPLIGGKGKQVWAGRPSVSVFYLLYGIVCAIVLTVLLGVELWFGVHSSIGKIIFPSSLSVAGMSIAYPIEILTIAVVVIAYLVKVLQLAILRARNKYVLSEDGLYLDTGILNLQNTYVAPMAFSDARLNLPLSMRLVHRGNIIVDTNDSRHFRLLLLKDPVTVQSLIRRTLGHPVVRVESPSPP